MDRAVRWHGTSSRGAAAAFSRKLGAGRELVIADAAREDEALVRSLGPDHVVPRHASFASAVRELVPDGGDALADAAVQRDEVVDAVRDGAVVFDVRGWQGNRARGIEFVQVIAVLGVPVVRQARAAAARGGECDAEPEDRRSCCRLRGLWGRTSGWRPGGAVASIVRR